MNTEYTKDLENLTPNKIFWLINKKYWEFNNIFVYCKDEEKGLKIVSFEYKDIDEYASFWDKLWVIDFSILLKNEIKTPNLIKKSDDVYFDDFGMLLKTREQKEICFYVNKETFEEFFEIKSFDLKADYKYENRNY